MSNGRTTKRPVNMLIPLEIEEELEDDHVAPESPPQVAEDVPSRYVVDDIHSNKICFNMDVREAAETLLDSYRPNSSLRLWEKTRSTKKTGCSI
ncbi:hypothetical protein ANCDUO_00307 [Ancylostoma duodenale]|uniref:Uncharacterized protein n=1 Tax=Ancylostoma duodenale TaxID=51022 RepID=A0A0C2DHE3_9BILA|nr:hypothetical protein ANCDUO_00307 [Ancylostoma duodenale]